jgi:hypothetical protein
LIEITTPAEIDRGLTPISRKPESPDDFRESLVDREANLLIEDRAGFSADEDLFTRLEDDRGAQRILLEAAY